MFCLHCGAEAPARGTVCLVCGHDLGRSADDLRSSIAVTELSLDAGNATVSSQRIGAKPLAASAGIRAGDLDRPGLPQDLMGRALLIVALAVDADVLLPWRLVCGQHQTLPVGTSIAIVVLMVLAALPLFHPRLRRSTISAALPMLVGGICLGVGAALWMNVGYANDTYVACVVPEVPSGTLASLSATPLHFDSSLIQPDFGLFGFLVGALLLVVIGYSLFLVAARATETGNSTATAIPTAPVVTPGEALVLDGLSAATAGRPVEDAGQRESLVAVSTPELALPGSDSWNRTLEPPTIPRPRPGSIRRSNR